VLTNVATNELVEELIRREAVDHVRVKPHHPYEVAVIDDLGALNEKRYRDAYAAGKPMHDGGAEGPCIIIVVED
jgi:hypothetical protein